VRARGDRYLSRLTSIARITTYAALVVASVLAGTASAQTSTGGIRGIVRDGTGGVLVGVTVEASSPARMGTAVVVTDNDGAYRLENLPVGQYSVTFSLSGFATVRQEGIRVEVGRSIELDQALKVSAVAETVTVSGLAPVVDTVHGGTSSNFNTELVQNIAVSRTSFFDVPALAPGVQVTNSNIGAGSGFNINGSDNNQNAFQYDGLDVSAPSFGGPFDWPNFDMMQEMQVKSIGASAEYAGFEGGVINLVLKSGSNQFRGSGSFYGIWNSLQANNTPYEQYPRKTDHRLDYNYNIGGPIVKDKLWFQYISEHIRWERADGLGVPPNLMDKTRIWRPFIKIDAHPTNNDTFSVHYNDCRDWWGYGAGKLVPPIAASVEIGKDPVVIAQWSHTFGSATLLEVKGGGVYINKDYVPQIGDRITPGHIDVLTGASSVNRTSANTRDLENRQNLNASLSHTATDFLKGTHEFKFGVQTTPWNTSTIRGGYASGRMFYDLGTQPYYVLTQEPYAQGGTIKMYGTFAQDDWTINDRATINLGIRYDRTKGSVPSLEQLDSTLEPTGKTFAGIPDVFRFNDVSPRLGFALKLDQSAKTVLKGHWGRYFSKMIAPQFQGISPGNTLLNYFFFDDKTGKYDIPYYSIDPKANYAVDPHLSNQWVDQYFVGIERQLQPNFGINVSFLWKKESNFIRVKDVSGTYAAQPFVDAFNGRTQTLTVFNRLSRSSQSLYEVINRDDLDQDYKSFTFEANKRLSARWQLQASYTWQRNLIYARGTVNSQGFGFLSRGAYGSDPNDLINAYARSGVDSRHAVRLSGSWEAPWGIHLGATYFGDSGRPYARIIRVPLNQGARAVIAEPRGTYMLPALNNVKMRLDKDFPLGRPGQRLRLSLDVQNLFNSDTPNSIQNNSSLENYYTGTGHVGILNVVPPRQAQVGIRFEF